MGGDDLFPNILISPAFFSQAGKAVTTHIFCFAALRLIPLTQLVYLFTERLCRWLPRCSFSYDEGGELGVMGEELLGCHVLVETNRPRCSEISVQAIRLWCNSSGSMRE